MNDKYPELSGQNETRLAATCSAQKWSGEEKEFHFLAWMRTLYLQNCSVKIIPISIIRQISIRPVLVVDQ